MKKYNKGDRVRIYMGNADGSIPGPDYRGTVENVLSKDLVSVKADDGDVFSVHVKGLAKL